MNEALYWILVPLAALGCLVVIGFIHVVIEHFRQQQLDYKLR